MRLLDADLVKVDTEENRKITRIKVTSISNLLEIMALRIDLPIEQLFIGKNFGISGARPMIWVD